MQRLVDGNVEVLRSGERITYVVRLVSDSPLGSAGSVVGTTSLGEIDLVNESVHLGWTAYAPAVWATSVNAECKLLVLGHAFDDCGFGRVKIQTDSINTRSQAAIAKLGATREGVMRRQYLMGAVVDYSESLHGAQFVIRNPNAKSTCGCGSSFTV
jgi:RimJ/RimL family protein N-acetyltransferase